MTQNHGARDDESSSPKSLKTECADQNPFQSQEQRKTHTQNLFHHGVSAATVKWDLRGYIPNSNFASTTPKKHIDNDIEIGGI